MDSQSQMENRMRLATKNEMDQPNKLFPISIADTKSLFDFNQKWNNSSRNM